MGVAATPYPTDGHYCRTFSYKDLVGRNLSDLLPLLTDGAATLERALGLAAANALANSQKEGDSADAIKILNLSSADRVCMVRHCFTLSFRKSGVQDQHYPYSKELRAAVGLVEQADQVKALESCTK